jgi:bifunctional ADP-heptose synthase (sugar kinase/adenylyltransferase)
MECVRRCKAGCAEDVQRCLPEAAKPLAQSRNIQENIGLAMDVVLVILELSGYICFGGLEGITAASKPVEESRPIVTSPDCWNHQLR